MSDTETVENATEKSISKKKKNFSPEQIEILKERLARGRQKRQDEAKKKREAKAKEILEKADEETTQPDIQKPIPIQQKNTKNKGYAKIVFYEKPTDDFDTMKIKFKNKNKQPRPVIYESEESEESEEEEVQANPHQQYLQQLARQYFG